MAANCVELGFVEEVENSVRLTCPFFPCKVGGKPAWLARSNLPDSKLLLCKSCEKPLIFLLQVYVPSDNEDVSTFHRTIFVFCCRDGACYKANTNKCFRVFRCQLPQVNEFYDVKPCENENGRIFSEFQKRESQMSTTWSPLCEVCGCLGEKQCGRCHVVHYCSKEHQTIDWKRGHKTMCSEETRKTQAKLLSEKPMPPLFPEYELVTEPEEINDEKLESKDEEKMEEFKKYMKENGNSESGTESDKEWELLAAESIKINSAVKDKTYWEFKKRTSNDPDQVVRYQRNGVPLWISNLNVPEESDIPKCPCGSDRTFEFQILPQLLNYLKVDSLQESVDWGTVVIYTCSKDCDTETVYGEEFVWKQDFSEMGLATDILSKLHQ